MTKRTSELLIEDKQVLTENQLNDLEWAKEFMEKYEKRHAIKRQGTEKIW